MDALSEEYDKITKRGQRSQQTLGQVVDDMLKILSEGRDALQLPDSRPRDSLTRLLNEAQSRNEILQQEEKEMQTFWNKFSKLIDRQYKSGLETVVLAPSFISRGKPTNWILAHHFLRQGRFDLFQVFSDEAKVELSDDIKEPFRQMFEIVDSFRQRNLTLAIQWAQERRESLNSRDSSLEFELHRLRFLQLIVAREIEQALAYSKTFLMAFTGGQHSKEVQRLMGCLLYLNRLDRSPYADLFSSSIWDRTEYLFTRECCALMGLPYESPLYITLMVGSVAIPILLKMGTVMKNVEWSQKDELPVEIPLGRDWRYHSIFICPVSKEQQRDDNPPMMMPCGHVVLKESLTRLAKGGNKFKCPYCPSESTPAQAKRVYF
jgi:E3 ubiquitin-protein transferase RMND5